VICPNGHTLYVKDELGGRTGLCPSCKARVHVPKPHRGEVSEDAIMGILGPADPVIGGSSLGLGREAGPDNGAGASSGVNITPKRSCDMCNRQIDGNVRVCPYCHTYLVSSAD
jgi:hypothetical protein